MSQEPASNQRPAAQTGSLTGYDAAPPMRSAYPSAADGGFQTEPVRQPEPGAAPGPGYGDPGQDQAAAAAPDWMWMLIPVVLALVLGLGTVVAVSQWPVVITVAVAVVAVALTAAVLGWAVADTVRRSVLIAAAGPVGVLIGYWVIVMFRG